MSTYGAPGATGAGAGSQTTSTPPSRPASVGRRATAAAPNSARPPRRWRTSVTRGWTGCDGRAAGDEGQPLVVAEAVGQRGQQPAREARHAAPGEQGARVDTHLHRERTV